MGVGTCVYRNYTPKQCGKIVEDLGPVQITRPDGSIYISPLRRFLVRWHKGHESEAAENELCDYELLVEGHRRKYENQSVILAQLKML